MFGWTESHSVEITAIAQSSIGILAFCFYIIFIAFDLAK
jgi:hypothetical protein